MKKRALSGAPHKTNTLLTDLSSKEGICHLTYILLPVIYTISLMVPFKAFTFMDFSGLQHISSTTFLSSISTTVP